MDAQSLEAAEVFPLTPEHWPDFEQLFGSHGAYGGCWCMWWRLPRQAFEAQKGEANRQSFKAIVESGEEPGLLAYIAGQPVGWCAVAPRASYPTLDHTQALKAVDDQPVWSVPCFYIARQQRQKGLSVALLHAAVAFAGARGARIVEGYAVEPRKPRTPDPFAYTGLFSAFRQAGFVEVARRSPTRPIMRFYLVPAGE